MLPTCASAAFLCFAWASALAAAAASSVSLSSQPGSQALQHLLQSGKALGGVAPVQAHAQGQALLGCLLSDQPRCLRTRSAEQRVQIALAHRA